LSPGSIIDIDDFWAEYERLPPGAVVKIHQNAAVVTKENLDDEKAFVRVGSTMKGTGSAAIQKMARNPDNMNTARQLMPDFAVDTREWFGLLQSCKHIQLSVPQGHSLSLNHGFYPYCTSRNTSPQQALADAGIPIRWVRKIIACMRTYPIRVANRYDEAGNMIGYSGPCYDDQVEMTWAEVGQKAELTSVSKKVRRVFSFSYEQYQESCLMNGVTDVFMNFVNYLTKAEENEMAMAINSMRLPGTRVSWIGRGPTISDIYEL
jgi:adenylosuccinate synthase